MPQDHASAYNQGLIELGALVCIPGGEPKCKECPMASVCLTGKNGWWKEIPWKSPDAKKKIEEKTVFLIQYKDKVAIRKRPPKGLLASLLYELPNVEGHVEGEEGMKALGLMPEQAGEIKKLPEAKHTFSHVQWHMTGWQIILAGGVLPASLFYGHPGGIKGGLHPSQCFFGLQEADWAVIMVILEREECRMGKMLFVFNPRSGREQIRGSLMEILDIFTKAK